MSETLGSQGGLSRRSFLKTTAVTATAGAVLTSAGTALTAFADEKQADYAKETVFSAACRGNCMGGCPLSVTVRDGKVVKTEAWNIPTQKYDYRRICQRGRSHVNLIYNEKRVKYPLRRVDGTERGAGQWERVSWEDAIKEITDKWKKYQSEFGVASVGFSFGSGNYGLSFGVNTNVMGYYAKLLNVINATYVHHCYDELSGKYCQATGISLNRCPHFMLDSKCVIVWGANPTESIIHTWHFVMEAQEAGTKVIVVDPNYTIAASKADLWVPVRPGSDPALALALVKKYIEDGIVSLDTVRNSTTLPYLVRDEDGLVLKLSHIKEDVAPDDDGPVVVLEDGSVVPASGAFSPVIQGITEVAGQRVHTVWDLLQDRLAEWSFEATAELCDVPVSTIEQMYSILKRSVPTATIIGLGLDHYENGFMSYASAALLCAVSGNVMLRGGGIDMWDMCSINFYSNMAHYMPRGLSTSPKVLIIALEDILNTGKYNGVDINLKSIFFCCHNFVGNAVHRNKVIECLNRLELVVTSDIVMSDTARYSDIVLPVSHWFEQADVFSFYSPYMTLCEKAIECSFDSKDNFDIVQLLAKGMGVDSLFNETREDVMTASLQSPLYQAWGINYERLKNEKVIDLLAPDGSILGVANPLNGARANFYFGDPTDPMNHTNDIPTGDPFDWKEESLPHFVPPYEAWTKTVGKYAQSEISKKYPLVYSSYRNKFKCHSQFGYNEWLLEIMPEPTMMVCKSEMDARGVKDGDLVRVFNDRGEVVIKIAENNGIHEGMVVIPKGWQGDQFVKGHYANLTGLHCKANLENSFFFDAVCDFELYKG